MGVAELRRLKQLEKENKRLKRLVADLSLDKHMLQEVIAKKPICSVSFISCSEDARGRKAGQPGKKHGPGTIPRGSFPVSPI
jgi:hypothetical protein